MKDNKGVVCPECNNQMQWQEGLLSDGARDLSVGKYYCLDCNIFSKEIESREIRKGRKLAESLVDVHAMDKRITKLPGMVQIGILRERSLKENSQ